jgi:hypothetical protein
MLWLHAVRKLQMDMKKAMKTTNSIPEICELDIRICQPEDQDGDFRCVAEFRLFKGDIPLGDDECEITICKAMISLEVEGLSPAQGTRYGEPRKPNAVSITKSANRQTSRSTNYRTSADVDIEPPKLHLKAGAGTSVSGSSEAGTDLKYDDCYEHLRVRALPNLRWEVSEPDNSPLDGTYLEGDDLIRLQKADRANRASFRAFVTVKQRDIDIKQIHLDNASVSFFSRLDKNQRRLLDIFIAKSLSSALNWGKKYRGEIKLSEHNCEVVIE